MNAILTRAPSTDQGTFGVLALVDGTEYFSLELPWQENAKGESCIPPGVYTCKWIQSPKHGSVYQIMNVPGRDMIEIHPANLGGDKDKGFISELLGCIALGRSIGILNGQLALLSSRYAMDDFARRQKQKDFQLTIKWG